MKLLLLVTFSVVAVAQSFDVDANKPFYYSVAVHGAGTGLDTWSSWNQNEANHTLQSANGKFDAKGAAIKGVFFAGSTVAELLILKKYHPKWLVKTFTVVNFALGGEYTAIAISNKYRQSH